jgi:hypothetical protein
MNPTTKDRWVGVVMLVGIAYLVVGIAFGALANIQTSKEMRFIWRLAAWLTSAVVFVAHVWHGRIRHQAFPVSTAFRTSLAVAVGAFGLAVAANIHGLRVGSSHGRLLGLALVLWPVLTGVPAFFVALVLASGLTRIRPRNKTTRA